MNETLVKKLGIRNPADIINKNITVSGKTGPVTGVMKDFYDQSFRSAINPICIFSNNSNYSGCAVKINLGNTKATLSALEKNME